MRLGGVDFTKEDREKVLDVMSLLQEQGAVDEIGIGLIRDAERRALVPYRGANALLGRMAETIK